MPFANINAAPASRPMLAAIRLVLWKHRGDSVLKHLLDSSLPASGQLNSFCMLVRNNLPLDLTGQNCLTECEESKSRAKPRTLLQIVKSRMKLPKTMA